MPETIIQLSNGWTLRTEAGDNVRLLQPDGTEHIYWDQNEWHEDPTGVMAAIFGAATVLPSGATAVCRHCDRGIVKVADTWINPEATGDDSMWRETCEAHETFTAEHEPADNTDSVKLRLARDLAEAVAQREAGAHAATYLTGRINEPGIAMDDDGVLSAWDYHPTNPQEHIVVTEADLPAAEDTVEPDPAPKYWAANESGRPATAWYYQTGNRWMAVVAEHEDEAEWFEDATTDRKTWPIMRTHPIGNVPNTGMLVYRTANGEERWERQDEEEVVPDAEHRSFIVTQVQIMVGRLGMEWPDDDQRDNFIAGIADDLYAKFEIAPQPHRVPPVFAPEPTIDEAIDRAKREILNEVQAGRFVGSQIKRFADLHDHMDANTLGGLADDDFPLTDDEQIDFGNELQGRLDGWIRSGGMTDGIEARNDRWLTVGELRRHLARFPDDTPITATNAGGVDYLNVVGAGNPYQSGEPSLVLDTRDDFDVRQF